MKLRNPQKIRKETLQKFPNKKARILPGLSGSSNYVLRKIIF